MPLIASGFRRPFDGPLTLTQDRGVAIGENPYGIDPKLIHLGEDWYGKKGTPILAMGHGKVVLAEYTSPFGNTVIIEHTMASGKRVYSLYGHLKEITISKGDVSIGAEIGLLGDTGPGGLHLHWEVSYLNRFLDAGIYGKGYDTPSQYSSSRISTIDPSDFVRANPVKFTKADLVIQNAQIDDATVRPGQTVRADWKAKNVGNAEAEGTDTFIFLSRDRTLGSSDRYLDHEALGRMSVGESDNETELFRMPTGLTKGLYYLGIQADADLEVTESNENNNIAWIAFHVI